MLKRHLYTILLQRHVRNWAPDTKKTETSDFKAILPTIYKNYRRVTCQENAACHSSASAQALQAAGICTIIINFTAYITAHRHVVFELTWSLWTGSPIFASDSTTPSSDAMLRVLDLFRPLVMPCSLERDARLFCLAAISAKDNLFVQNRNPEPEPLNPSLPSYHDRNRSDSGSPR
mmetsp:Transcript_121359/g.189474  ORF Transcript_121359/g.189474 Transcript_121359/m.189474 type:complete len:176 (+) Transcript_121359:241-768(+)